MDNDDEMQLVDGVQLENKSRWIVNEDGEIIEYESKEQVRQAL